MQKLYEERDTWERQLITRNILLKLVSRFDLTTLERGKWYTALYFALAGFLRMSKFTYNKIEWTFSSWNLTQGPISFLEDQFFRVFLSCKTDLLRQKRTFKILATSNKAYAMKSLNNLFTQFLSANHYYPFSKPIHTFSRSYITRKL